MTKDRTKCTSFADCKKLLDQGKDIDYDGASGPLHFVQTSVGGAEPSQGTYDVYVFGADGKTSALPGKQVKVGN